MIPGRSARWWWSCWSRHSSPRATSAAERVTSAFDCNGVLAGANVRLDAWVTPPILHRPAADHPVRRQQGRRGARQNDPLPVPAGSVLVVRTSGGSLDVIVGGGVTEAGRRPSSRPRAPRSVASPSPATAPPRSARPSGQPKWRFTAAPDNPPSISLAKDPERQARGSLQMSYKIEDDYGVSEAHARPVRPRAPAGKCGGNARRARRGRCSTPPQFPLVLPNARTRNGVGQTVKDLSENPYAGADVTLTLTAKDEAGNEGKSEPFNMRLPERLFTKPLARALIEQRRILALDANKTPTSMPRSMRC